MTSSAIVFLCLLVILIVLFLSERFPVDITAISGLLLFVFLGYIDMDDAFNGFSSPAVITMMGTFFLGGALRVTGVADRVARLIHEFVGENEIYNIAAVMCLGATLSAFMTNVAAVAVLLPAVVGIAHHSGISPSRLLLPLAFSAVLGGMVTLIGTTPNILIGDIMAGSGLEPFSFFSFSPLGVLLVLTGIVAVVFASQLLLPDKAVPRRKREKRDLRKVYKLEERLFSLTINSESPLAGVPLSRSGLSTLLDLHVMAILRDKERVLAPSFEEIIRAGDVLIVRGRISEVKYMLSFARAEAERIEDSSPYLRYSAEDEEKDLSFTFVDIPDENQLAGKKFRRDRLEDYFSFKVLGVKRDGELDPDTAELRAGDRVLVTGYEKIRPQLKMLSDIELHEVEDERVALESDEIEIVEVILSPRSSLIGKTLRDISFRDKYGYQVLALWRAGRPVRSRVAIDPLHFGDALLLQGPKSKRGIIRNDDNFVVLSEDSDDRKVRSARAWSAIVALLVTIALAVSAIVPVHVAAFTGAALTVICGALTMTEAYREIEWKIIFLLACLIPIGAAVETTGVASFIAHVLVDNVGHMGPVALLIGFSLLASLLSQTLDGSLSVILLAPISLQTAKALDLNPYAFLMAITLSASIAFLTPFSHKANLLVMGAGGYRVADYFKMGLLLSVVSFLTLWIFLPILYPLSAS